MQTRDAWRAVHMLRDTVEFSIPLHVLEKGGRIGLEIQQRLCSSMDYGLLGQPEVAAVVQKKKAERMRSAFRAPLTNDGALYTLLNEPPGTRTQNPRLKRPLLYQLS